MKAIDIIELARSYYLVSIDHAITRNKPILIGGRIKLEYTLEGIDADMVVATAGNDKRCIILMDFTSEEILLLASRGEKGILSLKNGKN